MLIKRKRLDQGPAAVTERGGGIYVFTSESDPRLAYTVQVLGELYVCCCRGYLSHGHCKHGQRAVQIEKEKNMPKRVVPTMEELDEMIRAHKTGEKYIVDALGEWRAKNG